MLPTISSKSLHHLYLAGYCIHLCIGWIQSACVPYVKYSRTHNFIRSVCCCRKTKYAKALNIYRKGDLPRSFRWYQQGCIQNPSKMRLFAKINNDSQPLNIFSRSTVLDVWLSFTYVPNQHILVYRYISVLFSATLNM